MSAYELTPERRAEYAKIFDFRTQFVKAARQILAGAGITALGPGEGKPKISRTETTVDFLRGAATGRQTIVSLGGSRYREYSQFYGVLSIMNTSPYITDGKTDNAYITEDHVRALEELTSNEHALFMEHLEPFSAELLPNLDVQEILPIEPDERPAPDREVNASYMRWRVKFEIRNTAWPRT